MSRLIPTGWRHYPHLLRNKKYLLSLLSGFFLFILSLVLVIQGMELAQGREVISVGDIVLDRIPTLNLNMFYGMGIGIIVLLIAIYPLLYKPEILPFTLKTFAAFGIIRAIFINLTHYGPPNMIYPYAGPPESIPFLARFFFSNDLFFSAHTGIPYLASLIFWENKALRYVFLLASFVMGGTVLFMHIHYSIDVAAAYFITYSIYKVSDQLFLRLNLSFRRIIENIQRRKMAFRAFVQKQKDRLPEKLRRQKRQ